MLAYQLHRTCTQPCGTELSSWGAVKLMAVNVNMVSPGSDGRPGVLDEPLLWLSARCISTAWSPSSKSQRRGEHLYCRWSPNHINGLPPAAGSLNLLESSCSWCSWSVRGNQQRTLTKIRHIRNTSALPFFGMLFIMSSIRSQNSLYKHISGVWIYAGLFFFFMHLGIAEHVCINLVFPSDIVSPDSLQGCTQSKAALLCPAAVPCHSFREDNKVEPATSTLTSNFQGSTWRSGLSCHGWAAAVFTPQSAREWVPMAYRQIRRGKGKGLAQMSTLRKIPQRTHCGLFGGAFINPAVKCLSLFSSQTVLTINCTIKTILSHTEQ